ILFTILLTLTGLANAYQVGQTLSLDELSAEADIIFKGTAVTTKALKDESVKEVQGFIYSQTEFKVVSVLNSNSRIMAEKINTRTPPVKTFQFRHYDLPPDHGYSFQPQHYHFQPKRSYIVFAKKTDKPDVYKQLWFSHKIKEDQGVLLCADDKRPKAMGITEAFWTELTAMLTSSDTKDVIYAIRQLDWMGIKPKNFLSSRDCESTRIQAAIHKLIASENPDIAQAAMPVIGSHNPYMTDYGTSRWLVTVAAADIPYRSRIKPAKINNIGGKLYWRQLAGVANSKAPAKTRALAIRALGFVGEKSLRPMMNRWLSDKEPDVRASATLLLADFPGKDTLMQLPILVKDPTPQVRGRAATTIGILQQKKLLGTLATMLNDKDKNVRRTAAMSLQSFSPKDPAVAKVFRDNLKNKQYHTLILNALAQNNPKPYIDELALVINKTSPERWKLGQVSELNSWKILFKYINTIPTETLKSGTYDRHLDAMESIDINSRTHACSIYEFYLNRDMSKRAAAYRKTASQAATFDLDKHFKQIDKSYSNN
ncbi:HEAT repeat domain-containing protein, partial [Candidatus Sumerlaeota bacterium]